MIVSFFPFFSPRYVAFTFEPVCGVPILADEPSGNLDSESAENLHQLFFKLRDEFGQTFVIVTHNQELANMADRKLTMVDGKIINN